MKRTSITGRSNVLRIALVVFIAVMFVASLAACGSDTPAPAASTPAPADTSTPTPEAPVEEPANTEPVVMVWNPNESGAASQGVRDAFSHFIYEAIGREVIHRTTTDYVIAIEAMSSGEASIAYMGAVGYIEASNRNADLDVLVVNSGPSGTLDDALYFSWLAVRYDNMEDHLDDAGNLTHNNIPDMSMSFVSMTSTSGFVVPSSDIIGHFAEHNLDEDALLEPGFFSDVLFGGSHQGSAVNVLDGRAQVGAFADIILMNYLELVEGEHNMLGAVYAVREGVGAPFDQFVGERIVLIRSVPVLNPPFVFNTTHFTAEEVEALRAVLTSDEVTYTEEIFFPADGDVHGLHIKTADERFLVVDASWYQPLRDMVG